MAKRCVHSYVGSFDDEGRLTLTPDSGEYSGEGEVTFKIYFPGKLTTEQRGTLSKLSETFRDCALSGVPRIENATRTIDTIAISKAAQEANVLTDRTATWYEPDAKWSNPALEESLRKSPVDPNNMVGLPKKD